MATTQLNPSEISELIKSRIQGLEASADVRNQGTVISVTDGIVRIHGLDEVMAGLTPTEVGQMLQTLRRLAQQNRTAQLYEAARGSDGDSDQ